MRDVGQAAHGTAVVATDDTWDGSLAKGDTCVAHTRPLTLQEGPPKSILVAVEEGLNPVKPLQHRPTKEREKREGNMSSCSKYECINTVLNPLTPNCVFKELPLANIVFHTSHIVIVVGFY